MLNSREGLEAQSHRDIPVEESAGVRRSDPRRWVGAAAGTETGTLFQGWFSKTFEAAVTPDRERVINVTQMPPPPPNYSSGSFIIPLNLLACEF